MTTNNTQPKEETQPKTEESTEEKVELDAASLLKERDELKSQIDKLQNDLRSREGQRRKQSDIDSQLAGIQDELSALRRVNTAYIQALQKGETDGLDSKIAEIDRDTGQSRNTRVRQNRYDQAVSHLFDVVNDSDGTLLLSEEQAKEIQTSWAKAGKEAMDSGDFSSLHDLTIEAGKLVLKNQRESSKKEADRIRKDAKEQTKKQLEDAGIHDLDTGASAGGGSGVTTWAQAQKIKKLSDLSDKDYEKLVAG